MPTTLTMIRSKMLYASKKTSNARYAIDHIDDFDFLEVLDAYLKQKTILVKSK